MPQQTQPAGSLSALGQFQYTMAQWLELQKEMAASSQKFLETQQAVMMAALQGSNGRPSHHAAGALLPPSGVRPALPAVAPPAAPVPAPAPLAMAGAPVAPSRPPVPAAPVLPATKPAVPARAAAPALTPAVALAPVVAPVPAAFVAAPAPAPVAAESAAAAPAATPPEAHGGDGPPPVEVFRKDLLEVISDRTGYPVEMLDEKLDLETGLGIDSIKTLEILSMLGKYHAYLPGASEDQEATMATFASLRTIGDIVKSYETNTSHKGPQAAASAASVPSGNGSGTTPVERAGLRTVEAGRGPEGALKKKSSLGATSS